MHERDKPEHGGCHGAAPPAVPATSARGHDGEDAQLPGMHRRLQVALALTVPLVALAAGGMRSPSWVQLLLATPAVLWCGWPLLGRCWRSLAASRPDRFTLAGLGIVLSYCSGVVAMWVPGSIGTQLREGAGAALYFESAAAIVTLALLGQWLELRACRHAAALLQPGVVGHLAETGRGGTTVQGLAERAAARLVPAVLGVAVVAAIGWWAFGGEPRLAHAVVVAVSTLVIACPRALGLAVPLPMTLAIGRGARAGVLLRDAGTLERLRDVDTIVFDKTGTLTMGRPEVVSVIPVDGIADSELLRYAASLEQASEHPVAAAVVATATARGLRLGRCHGLRAVPGKGAMGVVQLRSVAVGNAAAMEEAGVEVGALEPDAQQLRTRGQTVVYVGVDGAAIGLLGVADPLKPEAWDVVQQLKREGVRIMLLSGDHEESVRAAADQLGIAEVAAGVLPGEKAGRIAALRAAGEVVAMVGDGSGDAPALAAADVGIAIDGDADSAGLAADVTLPGGNLHGVPRALRLGEAAMRNAGQNLLFAFGYNATGVLLAAGALYPMAGLLVTPVFAVAATSLGSLGVVANSLRLRSARI